MALQEVVGCDEELDSKDSVRASFHHLDGAGVTELFPYNV
jgi:hypothetical protein